MKIGIDVGGTHTDAVLMDGDRVVAAEKALTSADISTGIVRALDAILSAGDVADESIDVVMLGTTQFTNAVIERRELSEVAAIRIGLPSGQGLPPKVGWPEDLAAALGNHVYMMHGGFLYDGCPLAPLDEQEIDTVVRDLLRKKLTAISIASAFSPMNPQPEEQLATRIRAAIPEARITMSHRIGRLGLLERENAALLNTGLLEFAGRVVASFTDALQQRGLTCPFYISQNDGTLMDADFARHYPALTFASGPTNSLRGASRLSGLAEAIVIDVGGTTSDIGILHNGLPRESGVVIDIGGVRTNFRMPDILALGLGGGSVVSDDGNTVGPQSVGHELISKARIFGGAQLTLTDLAVAAGRVRIGDPARVADIEADVVTRGLQSTIEILHAGIDRMRPSSKPLPVILVGGGAVLVREELSSQVDVICPRHAGVANAIGASIAQIGGEAERLVSYAKLARDDAIAAVTEDARESAIAAGADRNSLTVVEVDETTIAYMAEDTTRLRVKVIGDIAGRGWRTSQRDQL